ncbi:MAG: GEVED domain-containing protein, partial [Cyanobacteria bacterium J06553_1]
LVGAALLSASILPATAAGTPAGTTIDNTAFGSFENPTNPTATPTTVNSNTVTITVAEIAGITVTPLGAVEAPAGVAGDTPGAQDGPAQGDGVINEQDILYFTYRITNTGNDQTQFFIPGSPSNVDNGSFNASDFGPIEVVGYSADGVNVTPESAVIPATGANTDTLGLTVNDGSVPVNGFIEVRVPIKVDSGLASGAIVDPTLGNATVQNSPEDPAPDPDGVATRDNSGTDNGDESAANPATEREASSPNPVTLGDLELDYGDAPDAALGSSPAPDAVTPADYETAPGRGPSHINDGTVRLGTVVDIELNAFEDNTTAPLEDNGVRLDSITGPVLQNQSFITGQSYDLNVAGTGGAARLSAWIDFNRDGVFDDGPTSDERVAADVDPTTGNITIAVPTGAASGVTYARFRYSTETGLAPTGAAGDGEVEDYEITIVDDAASLRLVKRVTSVRAATDVLTPANSISTVVDPTTTADVNDDAGVNWPTDYLEGAVASDAAPNELVDYTIYFLSDGNVDIDNVRICDFIPANTTYVAGSLQISQGGNPPSTATPPNLRNLTDIVDALPDTGQNFGTTTPAGAPCDPAPGANT